MWQLDAPTLITVLTIIVSVAGIVLGSIAPSIVEGIATKQRWKPWRANLKPQEIFVPPC